MPKYQYQCKDCGEALEVQQSFTDDALTVCPHCGGDLRKVFNAVGVVFKGSGFYKTDSRSGASSTTSTSTTSSTSSDSKPAKTESAPAPKAEAKPAKKSGSDSAA
ncbi:FmdB family zinc ribbon protein [Aeromicrobium stalagmiti]|uniref:FmdB family zinc ribbon protein n=1 Tax=Aeromicrobium stalagmiti TaxID=2738988 RepID=UPI0015684EB8|nr:FmdB family transcriptional regulator [Aeromicrobium stalagmiti]